MIDALLSVLKPSPDALSVHIRLADSSPRRVFINMATDGAPVERVLAPGSANRPLKRPPLDPAAPRECWQCHHTKSPWDFESGRGMCRDCRSGAKQRLRATKPKKAPKRQMSRLKVLALLTAELQTPTDIARQASMTLNTASRILKRLIDDNRAERIDGPGPTIHYRARQPRQTV